MTIAPGFNWVRRSSRVRPIDVAPYLFSDEQEPHPVRVRTQHRIMVKAQNESNPRFADFLTHKERLEREASICATAQLAVFQWKNGKAITQEQYDAVKAASMLYTKDFKPLVPEKFLVKMAQTAVIL